MNTNSSENIVVAQTSATPASTTPAVAATPAAAGSVLKAPSKMAQLAQLTQAQSAQELDPAAVVEGKDAAPAADGSQAEVAIDPNTGEPLVEGAEAAEGGTMSGLFGFEMFGGAVTGGGLIAAAGLGIAASLGGSNGDAPLGTSIDPGTGSGGGSTGGGSTGGGSTGGGSTGGGSTGGGSTGGGSTGGGSDGGNTGGGTTIIPANNTGTPADGNQFTSGTAPQGDVATVDAGLLTPLNVPFNDPTSTRLLGLGSEPSFPTQGLVVDLGTSEVLSLGSLSVGDASAPVPMGNPLEITPSADSLIFSLNAGPLLTINDLQLNQGELPMALQSAVEGLAGNAQGGISLEQLIGANVSAGNYFAMPSGGYTSPDHPALYAYTNRTNLLTTSTSEDGPTLTVVGEKGDMPNEPNYPIEVGAFGTDLVTTDRLSLVQLDGNVTSLQDLPSLLQDALANLAEPGKVIDASPDTGITVDFTGLGIRDVGVGSITVAPMGTDTFQNMATNAPQTDGLLNTFAPTYVGATSDSQAPTVQAAVTETAGNLLGMDAGPGSMTPPMVPSLTPPAGLEALMGPVSSAVSSVTSPMGAPEIPGVGQLQHTLGL